MRFLGRWFNGFALILLGLVLAGCATTDPPAYDPNSADFTGNGGATGDPSITMLHNGDGLTIVFSDVVEQLPQLEKTVEGDGSITLYYNQKFQAAGKTIGALQSEIRDRYVPGIFKNLTVTIKSQELFYTVAGEVKQPNRYIYTGFMTVTRAVATAGGFTDFARKSNIQVTRALGKTFTVDYEKAEADHKYDPQIYANDKVTVKKRVW